MHSNDTQKQAATIQNSSNTASSSHEDALPDNTTAQQSNSPYLGSFTDKRTTPGTSDAYMPKESIDFLDRIGSTFNTGALFRIVLTAQGKRRFTFLTTGFEQLFGIPVAAVLEDANAFYRLLFPDDVADHMKRERQSVEHEEPLASEVRMQSLVSGTRWIQFRAQPGYDTEGSRCLDGLLIDVTLHKQVEDQLREMATTDALTGLANRRSFMQAAERELHRAYRYNRPLSMLMVDADHFKKVNDTYGHDVGDVVLIALAKAMASSARKQDLAARLGGEEFAILLTETSREGAIELAERLRKTISDQIITSGELTLSITVSVGVSTVLGHGDTVSKLLKRSDDGLYEAKQNGRNQVCFVPATNIDAP